MLLTIKISVAFNLQDSISDPDSQILILVCDINNCLYTLAVIFSPNSHQLRLIQKLMSRIEKVKYGNLILCGDFTAIVDPHIDTTYPVQPHLPSLHTLLHQGDLYIFWCCLHDSEKDYTYFSARHNAYPKIDMFLVDKWLL